MVTVCIANLQLTALAIYSKGHLYWPVCQGQADTGIMHNVTQRPVIESHVAVTELSLKQGIVNHDTFICMAYLIAGNQLAYTRYQNTEQAEKRFRDGPYTKLAEFYIKEI